MAVNLYLKDGTVAQVAAAGSLSVSALPGFVDLNTALPGATPAQVVGSVVLSSLDYVVYAN
jgi:hypothetical protein